MDGRPTGTVTFLFTDVEASTRLWEEQPEAMEAASKRHDEILRTSIDRRGGYVFATTGDGFAAAFSTARDAIDAAVDAQRALTEEEWPTTQPVTVRMGLYTGETSEREGEYFGSALNRAARIMAAGRGGQVLVGAPTAEMLDPAEIVDLGEQRLTEVPGLERLFQVRAEGLHSELPPPRGLEGRRGNLPAPATSLIGRAHELAQVTDLIRASRLVTLTGVGGVGKTRLAIEAAVALADDFPDGVWLVELATVGEAASVPDAIATALGITPQAGVPATHAVADALAGGRVLLLLDNCEHVVDAAADAAESILNRSGTAVVLATSREGLRVGGERLFPVPTLDVDGGPASPAVELFLERARGVDPTFELIDVANAKAVTEICRGLDGIALAIELAAARIVSLTPVDLQQRLLADRFKMLTGSKRQRSLHDTVGWSYELLDEDERGVLQRASVFSGGFDLEALTAVIESDDPFDVLEPLDSLVRKSLVTAARSEGQVRYALLETIRQFAEDELSASGSLDRARLLHATYFATRVVERWEQWCGPGFAEAMDWVSDEFSNLRAAFRWSATQGHVETAVDVAAHTAMIGVSAELFESVGWVEEILDAASAADVRRLPRAYTAAGYSCFTGRAEQAVRYAQTAQRLENETKYDAFELGLATFIEALAQVYCGHLDRYVELTRSVASLPGAAAAYGKPGLVDGLQAAGLVDEAIALTDDAVATARARGNGWWIAYALWTRGTAYARVDPGRALAAWREALAYVQQHRVLFFEGFIARDAALLKQVDADRGEALTLFETAIDSFRRTGNVAQLAITLTSVIALFERVGRPDVAATVYGAMTHHGGDHHVPELPDVAARVRTELGSARFDECASTGAAMDLNRAASYARDELELTRGQIAAQPATFSGPGGVLSDREVEVLGLVAQGLTTREIADQLYISPKTADHHIQHVYTKIGVSSRAAAALWAFQHDVVS